MSTRFIVNHQLLESARYDDKLFLNLGIQALRAGRYGIAWTIFEKGHLVGNPIATKALSVLEHRLV